MKTCSKCGESKPRSEYHKCSSKTDGLTSHCKACRNAHHAEYNSRICGKEQYRRYRARDPEGYARRSREYYEANKERIKERSRKWRKENPKRRAANRKAEYRRDREKAIRNAVEWGKNNPSRRRQIVKNYKERHQADPEHRARNIARKMLIRALEATGKRKEERTFAHLGYTRSDLIDHIESMFDDGMTWENWGEWHIDHIIPVSTLVSCGVTDPKKINALSNLQPLWAVDNMSKSNGFQLAPPECGEVVRAT